MAVGEPAVDIVELAGQNPQADVQSFALIFQSRSLTKYLGHAQGAIGVAVPPGEVSQTPVQLVEPSGQAPQQMGQLLPFGPQLVGTAGDGRGRSDGASHHDC